MAAADAQGVDADDEFQGIAKRSEDQPAAALLAAAVSDYRGAVIYSARIIRIRRCWSAVKLWHEITSSFSCSIDRELDTVVH